MHFFILNIKINNLDRVKTTNNKCITNTSSVSLLCCCDIICILSTGEMQKSITFPCLHDHHSSPCVNILSVTETVSVVLGSVST